MSNPFPPTTSDPATRRPWLRVTDFRRATSTLVLGPGEFALTETGKQYNGDGVTALQDLVSLSTGSGGGSTGFQYVQSAPAATWTIPHDFGRRPSVDIYTITGELVQTDVAVSTTTATVTFPSPTSGYAILT